jgi:hypothetical protein
LVKIFTGETIKGCTMTYLNFIRNIEITSQIHQELGESGVGNTYVKDEGLI